MTEAAQPQKPTGRKRNEKATTQVRRALESFQTVDIHRRQIANADYNPRHIPDKARKKGIERHGLIAPITWNARTGNIVGGHQRVAIMDAIMGTDDYVMAVARVDVPPAQEKEQNLLLNNERAQGQTDQSKLEALLKDPDLKLEGTGFELPDLYTLFGNNVIAQRASPDELTKLADGLRENEKIFERFNAALHDTDPIDFFVVFVFRSDESCTEFLKKHGFDETERYHSGEDLDELIKGK